MALKSTIFKASLEIANVDRPYYQTHALTIARHPSETDERMMVRILVFALHAQENLSFGKGISGDGEPDLSIKDLTGSIESWIDVGLPDEKRVRRACGQAKQVFIYTYGGRGADMWWTQNRDKLERNDHLAVVNIPLDISRALAKLAQRNMQLQCTIQEGLIWFNQGAETVAIELSNVKMLEPKSN